MSIDALAALEAQAYQYIVSADEGSVDLALKEIAANMWRMEFGMWKPMTVCQD